MGLKRSQLVRALLFLASQVFAVAESEDSPAIELRLGKGTAIELNSGSRLWIGPNGKMALEPALKAPVSSKAQFDQGAFARLPKEATGAGLDEPFPYFISDGLVIFENGAWFGEKGSVRIQAPGFKSISLAEAVKQAQFEKVQRVMLDPIKAQYSIVLSDAGRKYEKLLEQIPAAKEKAGVALAIDGKMHPAVLSWLSSGAAKIAFEYPAKRLKKVIVSPILSKNAFTLSDFREVPNESSSEGGEFTCEAPLELGSVTLKVILDGVGAAKARSFELRSAARRGDPRQDSGQLNEKGDRRTITFHDVTLADGAIQCSLADGLNVSVAPYELTFQKAMSQELWKAVGPDALSTLELRLSATEKMGKVCIYLVDSSGDPRPDLLVALYGAGGPLGEPKRAGKPGGEVVFTDVSDYRQLQVEVKGSDRDSQPLVPKKRLMDCEVVSGNNRIDVKIKVP